MGAKAMFIGEVLTQENAVEGEKISSNYLVEVQNLIKTIRKLAKKENDKELIYLSGMIYISVSDRIALKKMKYE